MQIKGLGLAAMTAMMALVGCGSSDGLGGTGGSGGSPGKGGGAGGAKGGSTGEGGSTGSGGFTTKVPSATKLTALTTAQATQLCSDVESYLDSTFLPMLCHASAPLTGLEAAYLDLVQNPSASNSDLQAVCAGAAGDAGSCSDLGDGTQSCDVSSEPSTCQATVGDFTKCLDDTSAADAQYYATLPSCSTLTAASVTAFFEADGGSSFNPPEPTSCSMFDSTCDVDGSSAMSNMSLRMMPNKRR
jgi:hypothetical protein